jgi:hypothetical protein
LIGMARFLRPDTNSASDRVQRAVALRREVDSLCHEVEVLLTKLRPEGRGSRRSEPPPRLGEDHQVRMQPNPVGELR